MNPNSTPSQDLHVVFGSGPLGKAVVSALLARGKRVRVVNRSGKADLPAGVEQMAGDAYDPAFTARAAAGAAVIYQCAQPHYHEWVEKFPPLQRAILQGAAAAGAKAVIGDNLYMYGEVKGPIHEELPYAATTRKGKVRAAMASEALAMHADGRLKVTLGRGSDFFGPEALGSLVGDRVFDGLVSGKNAEAVGNIDAPHTYTYIKDFGEALAILGERPEADGQTWHVPNAETLTTRQFLQIAFEAAGKPVKINAMGRLMMMLGGLFIVEARESVEMMYEFEKPFVVDSSKFVRAFGDCATPLRPALAETVKWYAARQKGK